MERLENTHEFGFGVPIRLEVYYICENCEKFIVKSFEKKEQ